MKHQQALESLKRADVKRILIPAKGYSKRIVSKNLQAIHLDKPLIRWTLENYRRWFPRAKIHVATDDCAIKRIAVLCGCELYGLTAEDIDDTRNGTNLLSEFAHVYRDDRPILLAQCTSPFTFESEVLAALEIKKPVVWSASIGILHTPETDQTLSQHIKPSVVVTGNFIVVNDVSVPADIWTNSDYAVPVSKLSALDINTHDELALARFLAARIKQSDLDASPFDGATFQLDNTPRGADNQVSNT